MVPAESGDWTSFQNSPFKDFGGRVTAPDVQQMQGAQQPLHRHLSRNTETVARQFNDQAAVQSTAHARIDPFRTGVYTKEKSRHLITDAVSNDVIWAAGRSDPIDANPMQIYTSQVHEPPIQFQSAHAHLKTKVQNEGDFRHPFRSQNGADGSSSSGQYRPTEPLRSMSSDSDFTGFNSYNESDMKRIQSLHSGLVHTRTNTPVLGSSHRSHDLMQPDAPLLSKRGSRASTLFDASREPQGSDQFPSATQYDIEWQKDMYSVQVSTLPSNSDSMVQDGLSFLRKVDQENGCVVECPVIHQQPCKIDPQKTCSVRGVPLTHRIIILADEWWASNQDLLRQKIGFRALFDQLEPNIRR